MIEAKLEEIRRSLVDLTRNNRLLNHRSKGQRSLAIHNRNSVEIYRGVVDEVCLMQFLAREEAPPEIRNSLPAEDAGVAPTSAKRSPERDGFHETLPLAPVGKTTTNAADRNQNRNLQTLLSGENLQTRLVNLAREAHSAIEEQGCNILYCTFGMVEWREAGESSVVSRAPLIFVPVELKRKTVNTRYTVQLFDDDIVTNSSLIELCQTQFHFSLPAFDAEKDDIQAYFAAIEQSIAGMHGWRLSREINIGLYSFTKLQMFRDLDPKNWPDGTQLTGHPMVRCLAGVDGIEFADHDGTPDPRTLDLTLSPTDCFQIVDADSSQQAAIMAAKDGRSLVIDGPPGTGKSQTITNIIAECLAAGKTVLFVSEKSAALDVVKRRLTQVGLADFVLELHSRQASKKVVLEEINRVLEKQAATSRVPAHTAEELKRVRETLNKYARELHEPFAELAISPFEAMSRAIGLSAEPEANVDIPDVTAWTARQLAEADEQLETLDRRLARVGDHAKHPWRGVPLSSIDLRKKQQIRAACEALIRSIANVNQAAAEIASFLVRHTSRNIRDLSENLAIARTVTTTPSAVAGVAQDESWNVADAELQNWLNLGQHRQQLKQKWMLLAKPEADQQDWRAVLNRRRSHGRSILRILRPSWHSDGKRLSAIILRERPPAISQQIELLAALVESGELREKIEKGSTEFGGRFGTSGAGVDADWDALNQYVQNAVALRQLILSGKIEPAAVVKLLLMSDRSQFATAVIDAQTALDHLQESWASWLNVLGSNEKQWLKTDWLAVDLPQISARLAELPHQIELLDDWVDLRQSVHQSSNSAIKGYIAWVLGPEGKIARGRMAATFRRHFYRLWVDKAFSRRPCLQGFRGQDHEAIVGRFRELDRQWLKLTRDRLVDILAKRRPGADQTAHRQSKLGLLQAETRKKTRHMSLRNLLAAAGEVVQSIKPCFMMSPLSVAQYLAPGGLQFDVVIFDEASQVEPADAYGAVSRGKQLVLVGDERQLPPTNFFSRIDSDETDESDGAEIRSSDLESILSLGIVRLRNRCGLRWHYRSRHSSLIDFSNQKFYDAQLRIFPSPHTDCSEVGLAFHHVENAIYLRGAGRYNPVEALAVAEKVVRHAIERPDLSLGVGTLNQPQQRAVEDEIERLRRTTKDARVEQFFTRHANKEPFFVKNLENIQGDERDVIFLSVCFGKDASGKPPSANFGALNGEGGWRRLNVLITRARQRCVVFSSIRHDDINLGSTQARGVVALKEYLYAAEHGRLKETAVPGGDHDSDFEAAVCRSIRDAGWEVHAQVGCAGFSIDLAVVDPRSPGRYLLGVECDGATYHSSPTARDRDRLRQAVLEDLGWNIYRIWSTDWFQRPKMVLDDILRKLKDLKDARPQQRTASEPPVPANPVPTSLMESKETQEPEPSAKADPDEQLPAGVVQYTHHRNVERVGTVETLLSFSARESAQIIRHIVGVESPIHFNEALRAYVELFGARATARPREAFSQAVAFAIADQWFTQRDDFLWAADHRDVQVRHRGSDCPVTDAESIPSEEFEAAVKLVVKQQFGLKFDAVTEAAARIFGFGRTGAKLKAAVEQALIRLDQRGEIQLDNSGFVTLPHSRA